MRGWVDRWFWLGKLRLENDRGGALNYVDFRVGPALNSAYVGPDVVDGNSFKVRQIYLVLGFVARIGRYAHKDAALVTILYEAGAVPFVKTNIPQTLMVSF